MKQSSEEKTKTIRVVLVEPGKRARAAEIGSSLKELQKTVGGYIQAIYPFEEPVALICNEEGKLLGLTLNRALRTEHDGEVYEIIAGTFFICGCEGSSFGSLNNEQLKRYTEKFRYTERFLKWNDEILALPIKSQRNHER